MSRHSRLITNKKRQRNSKSVIDIDITSLLDILVILLVFLLKSYNSSGIIINVPQGITLPVSQSISPNNFGVIIQVSAEKIFVDSKEILNAKEITSTTFDHGKRRIVPLFNELTLKKQSINQIAKTSTEAIPFSGVANLIIDKSIKYSYIKKILYTCASAGFQKYKFVVLGEEQ